MPLDIVIGAQWGDEGKGRIVDLLSKSADLVARFNGGDNAGHTVTVGSNIFKLHLIPSGIVHPHTIGILGNGMVINPITFVDEISSLSINNIDVSPKRLSISSSAHLITPFHRALDRAQDEIRGNKKIGTTGRGIGPAYMYKAARSGLRCVDILGIGHFREKLHKHASEINQILVSIYDNEPLDLDDVLEPYIEKAVQLRPYIKETGFVIRDALSQNKVVLAEGAQGSLLDIDHGTYPFVTSSNTSLSSAFSGLGIDFHSINRVIGVAKVFQTRVGSGPFPTELIGDHADRLRGSGENPWDEFGTTTGRPRRVGWLDCVLLRYTAAINGFTELVLTKLDVLSGIEKIPICTGYRVDGKLFDMPILGLDASQISKYETVYEELSGWHDQIQNITDWHVLPQAAKSYINMIEDVVGVPVKMVSVGPERDQIIIRS